MGGNNLVEASPENISRAAEIIRRGGIVAFPTETVYGLGADAFNPEACARIFEAKNRPKFDPLIVHICEISELDLLCREMPPEAHKLAQAFWPGPLTLVLPKKKEVPDITTAGLPTVAIRMPSHQVARELIRKAGTPIAAPSANPFGYLSPTRAEHVLDQLGDKVDLILDGGPCPVGVESTILKVEPSGKVTLLRPGGLPLEDVEEVIGPVERRTSIAENQQSNEGGAKQVYEGKAGDTFGQLPPTERPEAPGQLPSHYAPDTPLVIVDDPSKAGLTNLTKGYARVGLLSFTNKKFDGYEVVVPLSKKGDLREAAANLFAALHELDSAGLDLIVVEAVPEEGLGLAIMNRLRRAARKRDASHGNGSTL